MRSLFCPPFTLIRNRAMSFDALVRPFDGAMPSMWNGLRWSFRQPTIVTALILAAVSGMLFNFPVPPQLRGQTMSVWNMAIPGMNPSMGLAAGLAADVYGARAGLALPAFSYAARGTTKLMLVGPHLATRDSRGGRLPSGCGRLPATGNWQLATGNWQLATGNWQLATGNWQLATIIQDPLLEWLSPPGDG